MPTLTDLQAQRDTLVRRITSLTTRVSFGDRTVEYDLSQAEKALQLLDREITAARGAAGGATRVLRLTGRSGY